MKRYNKSNCGCYVDSARGIYATDRIVQIARQHGAVIKHKECCDSNDPTNAAFPSEFAECPYSNEYEDEATEYMNKAHGVVNCYWGRNENGDWGLWHNDEEA